MLKPDPRELENTEGLDVTLHALELPPHLERLTLKELLRETYKHHRYAMYSNGGFRNSPLPTGDRFEEHDRIRVSDPFRLFIRAISEPGLIAVYVRGTCLEMRDQPWIRATVAELNKSGWMTIDELHWAVGSTIPRDHLTALLALFFRHRGIIQETNLSPASVPFTFNDEKSNDT